MFSNGETRILIGPVLGTNLGRLLFPPLTQFGMVNRHIEFVVLYFDDAGKLLFLSEDVLSVGFLRKQDDDRREVIRTRSMAYIYLIAVESLEARSFKDISDQPQRS